MARPRHITDEELLEVARVCFLEDPNVSTVTIAERVGLSQAALFKRFGTKMGLMLAAVGIEGGPPWMSVADRLPDERPVPEQLTELGVSIDGFFREMLPRMACMKAVGVSFREMFANHDVPPPVRGFIALRGYFQRAVDTGIIRSGSAPELAISFLGMFQGRQFWRHFAADSMPSPFPDDEAYIAHVVDVFWRGVAPEESSP